MKRWFRIKWLVFVCGTALWAQSLHAAAFDINALTRLQQQGEEVQGSFVQTRFLKSLPTTPLTSRGVFQIKRQQSLLWHVKEPFEQKTLVDDKGVQHWDGHAWRRAQRDGKATTTQLSLFMDLIGGRFDSISRYFELRLKGTEQQWQLTLTPKPPVMQKIFDSLELSGDQYVRSVKLHETQGDRIELRFDSLVRR